MNRLFFCFLLLGSISFSHVYAGGRFPITPRANLSKLRKHPVINYFPISTVLQKRIETTYRQALDAQQELSPDFTFVGSPIKDVAFTYKLKPAKLYPDHPFLISPSQTGKYMTARSNRLLIQEVQRLKQLRKQIDNNLPRLQRQAARSEHPKNPVQWLVRTIPSQTNQLFIGEFHEQTSIYKFVSQLLPALRKRFAQREIILFTEMLPANFIWNGQTRATSKLPASLSDYFPIWQVASQANIQTVGLELPEAIACPCLTLCTGPKENEYIRSIWDSLEGIRLRNESWQRIVDTFRQQHPDALFIIYTGSAHVFYNHPFTLARPDKNTFVLVFYPQEYLSYTPQDNKLLVPLTFPQRVIKWQTPDLPPLAGFDVRIAVPFSPSRRK